MRTRSGHRRRRLRGALVALGAVLAFVAIFAIWAERQSLRTDRWAETSEELVDRPEVRSAVAAYAVDQLYENVNVRRELRGVLPEDLEGAAGPAAAGLRGLAQSAAEEVIATERFQELWRTANRLAHQQFLNVINEEEGAVVTAEEEQVILDLRPLVVEIAADLGLGQGAIRNIPGDVGEIEIIRADELETAQTTADAIDGIALASSLGALAMFAFALAATPRGERWLTTGYAGAALIVVGIVALLVREVAGDVIVEALADPGVEDAASEVWAIGTSVQSSIAVAVILYGAGFLLAAWVGSPIESARRSRRVAAPILREYPLTVLALLAIPAAIWILSAADSERVLLTRLGLVLIAGAGVVLLRRQTIREFPRAELEDVTGEVRDSIDSVGGSLKRSARKVRARTSGLVEAISEAGGARGDAPRGDKSKLERLERLAELRERGALTKREFDREKAALLGDGKKPARKRSGAGRGTRSRGSGGGGRRKPKSSNGRRKQGGSRSKRRSSAGGSSSR